MNNLRERWRGLTALGVAVFAAACMTVAPAPSFADIDSLVGLQYIDHSESRNLTGFSVSRPAGTYYFDNDGSMQTGLVRCEDGNLRYFDPETGVMVTNQWYNDYEAVWYYFGADGTAVSNWQLIGGDWYYFYPEKHDMAYGRVQIDGKNYFLNTPGANADGRMQHSGWIYDSIYGKWLYATSSGELLTGWHNIGGTWYYFNEYGVMLTGWINDSGTWYYANASGAMATGWRQVGGAWYYFSGSGAMAHDAWVGDYYLQSSGAMATNAWVGSYYVGEDGKWIPDYGLVWYKSGSDVYHTHKCRTVGKDAKGYSQISIQEARKRGALRECKNCQQIG